MNLKPCPFCGSEKEPQQVEGDGAKWVALQCTECGARCGDIRRNTMAMGWPVDETALADSWNQRPDTGQNLTLLLEPWALEMLDGIAAAGPYVDRSREGTAARILKEELRRWRDRAPNLSARV